jgi:hypothetical protein
MIGAALAIMEEYQMGFLYSPIFSRLSTTLSLISA